MQAAPLCLDCDFFNWKSERLSCKVFPNGIPWPIISGEIEHTTPYPGDNGIQFRKIDEKKKEKILAELKNC